MKLFLVTRTDNVDWDEFDSFVIRAENAEQALKLSEDSAFNEGFFTSSTTEITELHTHGEPEVILGSFNAG